MLQQTVAVVTGSSSGIGRSIALELASCGADVLVHAGTNREAAEQVASEIRDLGRQATVILQDLAEKDLSSFVQDTWAWQGKVDIWVNNAGADVLTGDAASRSFEEKLARLWEVDVHGTIFLSRAVGLRMTKQRGDAVRDADERADERADKKHSSISSEPSIINIGWDQAQFGMGGDSGEMFATIKGAIMAFTRSLARSLAPQVRVNCVAPGWIKTTWGDSAPAYWQTRAKKEALLDRWGTPEDVARAVRFLVSPDAGFLTGQIINVNGGYRGEFSGDDS